MFSSRRTSNFFSQKYYFHDLKALRFIHEALYLTLTLQLGVTALIIISEKVLMGTIYTIYKIHTFRVSKDKAGFLNIGIFQLLLNFDWATFEMQIPIHSSWLPFIF